jgi:hypothetical protein
VGEGTASAQPATQEQYFSHVLDETNAAVGELAIADATLTDLLRDILYEATGQDTSRVTTGQAADKLLSLAKGDPSLLTPEDTGWLKRVKKAAERRNGIIHAVARDRCASCGQATRFEHHDVSVDRSVTAIARLVGDFNSLLSEGINIAYLISQRLNEREVAKAKALASATGSPQTPRQILIGQNWHLCAACGVSGAKTTVALPAAVAVLPLDQMQDPIRHGKGT